MAHKKGAGSSRNNRDSQSQRLGVKRYGGQFIHAGTIIIRPRGTRIHPGVNVAKGKADTPFATIDGFVTFDPARGGRRKVSVLPQEAKAA